MKVNFYKNVVYSKTLLWGTQIFIPCPTNGLTALLFNLSKIWVFGIQGMVHDFIETGGIPKTIFAFSLIRFLKCFGKDAQL